MSWASPGEQPGRRNRHTVAKRIQAATAILSAGDVLLLEVQFNGPPSGPGLVPVETQSDVFVAIQLAAARGIVVVEAAGNGGGDLDTLTVKGKAILNRTSPEFQGDSGAIMVGACTSKIPHGTHPDCNVGSRVDCNAWGDHMVVPGNVLELDKMDDPFQYHLTPSPDVGDVPFGHTSGASAIIAGVCLLVQHLRSILTPADGSSGRLDSRGMRARARQLEQRPAADGRQDRADAEPRVDHRQRVRLMAVTLLDVVRDRFAINVDPDSDGGRILGSLTPRQPFAAPALTGTADVAPLAFGMTAQGVSVRAADADDAFVLSLPAGPIDFRLVPADAVHPAPQVELTLQSFSVPCPRGCGRHGFSRTGACKTRAARCGCQFPDLLLVVTATTATPASAALAPAQTLSAIWS